MLHPPFVTTLAEHLTPLLGTSRSGIVGGYCDLTDFSVVIPTYRRKNQLGEALASVLRQSGVTLEILVIDDCPDGSARDVVGALQRLPS